MYHTKFQTCITHQAPNTYHDELPLHVTFEFIRDTVTLFLLWAIVSAKML